MKASRALPVLPEHPLMPLSLLSKLEEESSRLGSSLALASDPSEAAPLAKSYAERRFQGLLPKALDTIETSLETGETRDRLTGAKLVLDHAPATRDDSKASPSSPGLSQEALDCLASSLSKMASFITARDVTPKRRIS